MMMTSSTRSDYRLFLLEADTSVSASLKQVLTSGGWQVTCAFSTEEAKQALRDLPRFDLLLVAQELPDGQGMDLLEGLSYADELERRVPILLMAEREDPALIKRCYALGINDYLIKPLSLSLIALKVKSLTNKLNLAERVIKQNEKLEELLETSRREAEMASYVFYNNLLDHVSDATYGFSRYINASSDFCGDLVLSKNAPSGSAFILHADAMGKGLSATMTLLPLVDVFHSMVNKGYALPLIVREMNRKLHQRLPPDRFVAASLVELDVLHKQVSIWNGGMPPLYHLDARGEVIQAYESEHMPLGVLEDARFESHVARFALQPEGGLFGSSDGLTEQMNNKGQTYGARRLQSSLIGAPRHQMTTALVADLKEFSGSSEFDDDLSLFYVYFPELVHLHELKYQSPSYQLQKMGIDPFRWELTLFGRQLGQQDIPALCNDYLLNMEFPQAFCQRAFTIISELTSNAIEHGLLQLKSSLKSAAEGFAEYYILREQRLAEINNDAQLRIVLEWVVEDQASFLLIEIEQTGEGFDYKQVMEASESELAGRGLILVRRLAADLHFEKQGRLAVATLE